MRSGAGNTHELEVCIETISNLVFLTGEHADEPEKVRRFMTAAGEQIDRLVALALPAPESVH